jgi:protein TonB
MRHSALIAIALALPGISGAGEPYAPKFARVERSPEMLPFELCPKPEYPKSSLRNEEQGTNQLRFVIAPTGRLVEAVIERSTGFRALDLASLGALSRCRFRPASINGVPVQSIVQMQYVWTLEP